MSDSIPDPQLFINRELSWLEFNQRVLDEAADPGVPLLERVKFLSIVATNLDEFFMIRVAGVKQQLAGDVVELTTDGRNPRAQLTAITERVHRLVMDQYSLYRDHVRPALEVAGIQLGARESTPEIARRIEAYFRQDIYPVLTPLVIDPGHPFPHLKNKSINLGIVFESNREESGIGFAVVQVPQISARLVSSGVGNSGRSWLFLEDVIARNLSLLFPGRKIVSVAPFRVTRNWDLEIDEEEADDLLATIQQELRRRDRGNAVRLEVASDVDPRLLALLRHVLRLDEGDVYAVDGPLHLGDLMSVASGDDRPELHDEPFTPQVVPPFRDAEDPFALVSERDVMLHHPYESFESVMDFIARAADDPKVLAIKITLYRAGANSPLVRTLARAAENGKQVTALVELKARFDEEANIKWARALEESGVHVVYGVLGLKTHAKVCLIVRREVPGLRRYVHLSTGNYNPISARLYTDLSFFTARPEIGEDATALFNLLTGYCEPPSWKRLAVAPLNLRERVIELVAREAEHARQGRPARIVAKLNSLVDEKVITALYAASQAGVDVDLIIRGVCSLRPGLPGVSERIRVISIVDRFLEHARVFSMENGGEPEVYLSSADWMPRNFIRRVEVMFPIEDAKIRQWIRNDLLESQLLDNVKARDMASDGSYRKRSPKPNEAPNRTQSKFIERAKVRARASVWSVPPTPFRAMPNEEPALPPMPEIPAPPRVPKHRKKPR
nr:polyphosphate kinase 1 [Deltaproteobacteria bacterium]